MCAHGKVGKPGITSNWMSIQHVYIGKEVFVWLSTDAASSLLHVQILAICICASHPLEGQKRYIAVTDLEAVVLHGV